FSEETKPWTVAITVPMTSVLQSAVTMRNYVIANFVIFALIITLCLYFMTGKITKPIFQLVKSAGQIGHGNFDAEIPQFNQKDEIGTLSDAFRAMVRELQRRAEELIGKNERLGRLNEIKDEFLANTSHELRTPINGIIGIVESMMDGAVGELSDEQKYNLAVVANSGRRLSHLVNDILDFTKLKNREIELQLKSLDLYTVVDIVVMLSKPLIKNKDLVIVNDVGYSLPLIKADENRIQQILYNLIGNAVKFTEKGNVTISAEVQGNEVAVHIKDTGIGIEEKSYEKIFESFEQADGSTAREYGGSGLGLSITKKIVELHGGKITVESKIGSGSVFTFTIPVSTEQDAEEIDAEKTRITVDIEQKLIANTNPLESGVSVQPSDGKQRPRILTVDDEPVNIQVLFNMLSMCDFSVEKAFNGQEALELFEKGERFDLVLLDVMMPKLSGYDVCKRLRKTHSLLDLPIIMLTAKNQIQDVILGFRSGANDYVSKPFEKDVLIARINTLLELKTAMTAAEAAIKAKTLFLANMSHELRTPLNAVVGLTELLKNTSMDNTQRYYIDKMHQATLVLLALIENILDFSKIEAGKTRLQRSAFDLRKMFEYLKDLCRSHHSESPVKLVIDIDRDIPDVLLSDQERLQQILINLISNAYKFTEKGTITIKSELVRSDPNNVEISFSVSDTGIGMSPEQLEKIFAVFEQADTTSTRKYGGVGIGLTLARELVGLFGGTITVKSKEGVGTAFSFTIVFQIPESGSVSEAELYDAGKEPHDYVSDTTLKGMKVMLVEDNKINQMIAAELLKRVGVIVTTAANGQIALEKLMEARNIQSKDKPFDLILMDLQMPVMDGYEATKIIKGMPEYKDIPVYALTAHAFLEEQRRCFELGMEEHISKPINTKKLYDALRKAVLK
ncbi:MAG: ATP-binding protein, partial [Planctomycetaceae bacterium]|nr:ATP-binding protein [Planctomycetaceae bacterium]